MTLPVMSQVITRALVFQACFIGLLSAQSGLDQPQPVAPYLNGVFPANTPGSTPGGTWTTQNAFPSLSFPEPVRIVEHPRENKLAVVSATPSINPRNAGPAPSTVVRKNGSSG